jgi:hypothetical protein
MVSLSIAFLSHCLVLGSLGLDREFTLHFLLICKNGEMEPCGGSVEESCLIYNSQKLERTQMSPKRGMDISILNTYAPNTGTTKLIKEPLL